MAIDHAQRQSRCDRCIDSVAAIFHRLNGSLRCQRLNGCGDAVFGGGAKRAFRKQTDEKGDERAMEP